VVYFVYDDYTDFNDYTDLPIGRRVGFDDIGKLGVIKKRVTVF
jgi:hypothetical protein